MIEPFKREDKMQIPRPDCFEFVIDFLRDPEGMEIMKYVETLEKDAARYRWVAASPGDNGSLEWLESDEIDAYIDKKMKEV